MVKINHALIALDLSPFDEVLIAYARFLLPKFGTGQISLLHVLPDLNIPRNLELDLRRKFSPKTPMDELIREKIRQEAEPLSTAPNSPPVGIEVAEGSPYRKLIEWVGEKKPDLVVVGKKEESLGSGITARRMSRNLRESGVLFVPKAASSLIERILVPIDFSDNSARALQMAEALADRIPGCSVLATYVIDYPPTGYYLNQREYNTFNQMLIRTAESTYKEFLEEHAIEGQDIDFRILENSWHNIAGALLESIGNTRADLVIMGAQGHSALQAFLYGSVTEKILSRQLKVPVLVIR